MILILIAKNSCNISGFDLEKSELIGSLVGIVLTNSPNIVVNWVNMGDVYVEFVRVGGLGGDEDAFVTGYNCGSVSTGNSNYSFGVAGVMVGQVNKGKVFGINIENISLQSYVPGALWGYVYF